MTILANLLLACSFLATGSESIVINEFVYDDQADDDREFVELYNRSSKDVDISGWILESADITGVKRRDVVRAMTILRPGDFFVLGSAKVTGVDQVVGTTDLWDNGRRSLTLRTTTGAIVDTLVYESARGIWASNLAEGEGLWAELLSSDACETSWSRVRDGHDTDSNHDFRIVPATPGKTNDLSVGGYAADFDQLTVESELADFGASFVRPRVIDPTRVSASNPNAIPVSPQGGKCAVLWDPLGGGNHTMLLRDAVEDVGVEAWVYFDASPRPKGTREVWTLGVRGTTGSFYRLPNLSGNDTHSLFNGNTGIGWSFEATDSTAFLYLYDHNDGGWGSLARTPPKLLGKIELKKGVNDGWQRLRLEVRGDKVVGIFGGTYGCADDGVRIEGVADGAQVGGLYIGYREVLGFTRLPLTRPFTCDDLRVFDDSVEVTYFGQPKATTVNTPKLDIVGRPAIGKQFFVRGRDLVPNSPNLMMLGPKLAQGIDLGAFGGQPSSFLYVRGILMVLVLSDAQGVGLMPAPIPCRSELLDADLNFQLFDIDPALRIVIPVGNTRGMTVKVVQ